MAEEELEAILPVADVDLEQEVVYARHAHPPGSGSSDGGERWDHHRRPSVGKKAVAAITGSVAVSLIMTPFDVVKTRLQTQAVPEPLFLPSSHLAAPQPPRPAWPEELSSKAGPSSSPSSSTSSSTVARGTRSSRPPATCCQPTFFTTNHHERNLLCRFDPRVDHIFPSTTPANQAYAQSLPSSTSASASAQSLGKGKGVGASLGSSSSSLHGASSSSTPAATLRFPAVSRFFPTFTPSPSIVHTSAHGTGAGVAVLSPDCLFPDQGTAQAELEHWAKDRRLTGFVDGMRKILKWEGVRGLWRGLSPTLVMTVPSNVVYMTTYDHLRDIFMSYEPPPQIPSLSPTTPKPISTAAATPITNTITVHSALSALSAGIIARTLSATIVSPLELIRTRLQASHARTSAVVLAQIVQMVRTEGPQSLWKGLSPTLWRDVPFSGIYFAGYEGIKRALTGGKGMGEGTTGGNSGEEFSVAFISGAISGSVAATITHPFDVIKTHRQVEFSNNVTPSPPLPPASTTPPLPASSTSPYPSASSPSPSLNPRPTSTFAFFSRIVRQEGFQGLFRGLTPRVAKVSPACGIMIGTYELMGKALVREE